ncbi:hypothetical protein NHH03_16385 [Stieleria sp. TO1_6]|uniref:hypothetical protein n=1 Tax=Stieleria tagensis TaxID=2956795 RepID=UPI00209AE893|nr:hypothetical protein [Stieleria tagensis]MCO8123329.1 hypothetical protein [Stieleria tagensis]
MSVLEQSEFGDLAAAEKWAKTQEKAWIEQMEIKDAQIRNGPKWYSAPDCKAILKGVKTAWYETHVLLWAIDHSWREERKLMTYLNDRYGSIMRESPQPNGPTLCESMAEIPLAQSQCEGRRFRACSVLHALLQAHPQLAVSDLETLIDFECPVT